MDKKKWVELVGGGFAFQTASFAVHPLDKQRANKYLERALNAELTVSDAVEHARAYLETATGWPVDENEQLEHVRDFFSGKLRD